MLSVAGKLGEKKSKNKKKTELISLDDLEFRNLCFSFSRDSMTQPGLRPTWGGHNYPWAGEGESKWTPGHGWLSHKNTWLPDHVHSRSWPSLWPPAFPSFPLQGLWLPVPEEVPFQRVPHLFPSPASSHLASPLPNPLTQGNGDLMTFTPRLETPFFSPKDFYKPSTETFQKPSNFCPYDCFHFVPHGRAGLVPSLHWQSDSCAPRLPLITNILKRYHYKAQVSSIPS